MFVYSPMLSSLAQAASNHSAPSDAAATAEHTVSAGTTYLFAAVLVGLILSLALEEKLHAKKSVIAGIFAVVALVMGAAFELLPFGPVVVGGHPITMPIYIPAIDWGVISIILGSGLFVDVTSRSGVFTWIAIRLTKASDGSPIRLLWAYCLLTVVFSAVLNNVTAMIIVGSLTAVSLDRLNRNDKLLGFLLTEGLLTNIGGLLTLISSVPNIIVGKIAGISFVSFLVNAAPFVVVATVVTVLMGAKIFNITGFKTEEEAAEGRTMVAGFDENDGIESWPFFWFSTAMLLLFIAAMATNSITPYLQELGMGYVALSFGAIMLVRYKSEVDEFYRGIDWDLLGFFAALFVVINVMEHAKVLDLIGAGLAAVIGLGKIMGTGTLLVAAAGFSSVTDNIPLAAMLAKIIYAMPGPDGLVRGPDDPLWWSVIFGANLGGNLTPIGSASTLVAVTIMHKHKLPVSFVAFVVKALPFALVHIAVALVYVLLVLT